MKAHDAANEIEKQARRAGLECHFVGDKYASHLGPASEYAGMLCVWTVAKHDEVHVTNDDGRRAFGGYSLQVLLDNLKALRDGDAIGASALLCPAKPFFTPPAEPIPPEYYHNVAGRDGIFITPYRTEREPWPPNLDPPSYLPMREPLPPRMPDLDPDEHGPRCPCDDCETERNR